MTLQSRRIRIEEKKIVKRLFITLSGLFLIFLLALFAGLPLLAKIVVTLSSFRKDTQTSNSTADSLLFPPTLNPIYEATNTAKIAVSGFGEKDATVKILVNNREQAKASTDNEGKFVALNIILNEGSNNITAVNIKDNKESTTSSSLNIIYIKSPPKLEIKSPKDGDKLTSDNQNITITGETEAGSRVTISDRMAIVDPQGIFNFNVKLNNGDNSFTVISTDIAGNVSKKEIKVSYNP